MKTRPRGEVAKVTFILPTGEAQASPHPDAEAIRWAFADGSKIEVHLSEVPAEMLRCAEQFGIKTKLRNSYADANGVEAARSALRDVLDGLKAGNWNSGERGPSYALLPDALAEVLSISREDAAAKIAQREGEDAKAYRARLAKIASEPRIAKALVDLKPKGAEVDLAALLGE